MVVKDYFSHQPVSYSQFRPDYPNELYNYILGFVQQKDRAWDCATGNGQAAKELSKYFNQVEATDISEVQLASAAQASNINYMQSSAEETPFENRSFDLITVAQAVHWFDFPTFYKEVRRVLKRNGVLAIWGYGLLRTYTSVDRIIDDFYTNTIGSYWDPARKHIDTAYKIVPFPFKNVDLKSFLIKKEMTFESLEGYFNTWSAVHSFQQKNGYNPVPQLMEKLSGHLSQSGNIEVTFPVFMKVGASPKY